MKNEGSSMSTMVAVYSSSMEAVATLRNEPSKNEKIDCPVVYGYTGVYNIIACTRVIHTRTCTIISRYTFPYWH